MKRAFVFPISTSFGVYCWMVSLITAVAVISGCGESNHPPTITEVVTSNNNIEPFGRCEIKCIASDPDGDELEYYWSASGGQIRAEEASIIWIAPKDFGGYVIRVSVRDANGAESIVKKTVYVGENHSPLIQNLIAEYKMIERAWTCGIRCEAKDPDGDKLNYAWRANRGSIKGNGTCAKWVSPNTYVNVIVTVTVTDARAGSAVKKLIIPVVCCGEAVKNPEWSN